MALSIFIIIIGVVKIIGLIKIFKQKTNYTYKVNFANEYRDKFNQLSLKYAKSYDHSSRKGKIDDKIYVWLTMNVDKIQKFIGTFGIMSYKPAYQTKMFSNYQVIINTIPKFREGKIDNYDIIQVDECLLRYLGHMEEINKEVLRKLTNPLIWLREGFKEIFSVPILILNWFDIISNQTLNSIQESFIYKITTGIIALVSLISGLVTIIIGYNETAKIINQFIK